MQSDTVGAVLWDRAEQGSCSTPGAQGCAGIHHVRKDDFGVLHVCLSQGLVAHQVDVIKLVVHKLSSMVC